MSPPPETRNFYIYRDRGGTPAVVDSLSRVPKYGMKSLRVITLPKHDDHEPFLDPALFERILAAPRDAVDEVMATSRKITNEALAVPQIPQSFDPTSILLGAAVGFGLAVGGARLFKAPGWIIKVGLILAATTLGGGAYYGWVRARLGIGQGEAIVHPGTLVDDARRAVDAANQRTTGNEKVLEHIE